MNEMIFIFGILFFLGGTLTAYKLFGKSGLYVWTAFGVILANIQVSKSIDLFGFSTTAGNVLFASTFLATDILSERHGKKAAQTAVKLGLFTTIVWVIGTQLTLAFIPNSGDYISPSLSVVLSAVPRISISSIVVYAVSQLLDVHLYHFWWKKTGSGKGLLWLRNNGSTLISQLVDTVLFTTLAFWGVYPTKIFISIMVTTYVFKAIVALLDTPFMYIASKITPIENDKEEGTNE